MEISPENIKKKEFSLEKKGYNKGDVQRYLKSIAEEFESSLAKISNMEKELDNLNTVVEDFRNIEKDLREVLVFLKETERDTLIKTRDQVSTMLKDAENKSEEIVNNAEEEAKSTRDTLLFLKEQREIFIARLKIIIDSQDGMLKDFKKGNNSAELQKSMAEAAAFKSKSELNIDAILEKLL